MRAAIAVLGGLLFGGVAGCGAPAPPHVVVVLIDTLRADHVGFGGYQRPTSPALDALAAESWVFERHVASASQTVPSTLSLMLSLDPSEHGFRHERNGHFQEHPPRYPEAFVFLAEVFAEQGYATAAFVGNPFLQRKNGFGQGFERLVYSGGRGEELTGHALEWLDEQAPGGRPLFLYLHYFDVHWPYDPPEPYRSRFRPSGPRRLVYVNGPAPDVTPEELAFTRAMYDGEIAYVDDQVKRLLGALSARGLRDDAIVAVTSDHGDEFLDHGGLGHGTTVYGFFPLRGMNPQLAASLVHSADERIPVDDLELGVDLFRHVATTLGG